MDHILLRVKVLNLAYLTVSIPLLTLVFCFATSMWFQYTAVNTTVCKVYNFCPSVSAITGISPQRYIWRIGVALHTGPRLLLASLYPRYFYRRAQQVEPHQRGLFLRLVRANYMLHLAEAFSLVGVTYVSNRENYRRPPNFVPEQNIFCVKFHPRMHWSTFHMKNEIIPEVLYLSLKIPNLSKRN